MALHPNMEAAEGSDEPVRQQRSRPLAASVILIGGAALLAFCMGLSISVGAKDIGLSVVWESFLRFDKDLTDHQIIRALRMPRTLACALTGAAFAVAGSVMQGMTRNPLADPGLLGINAGAGFMLAISFAFIPHLAFSQLIWLSFAGAAGATALIYGIGSLSRGGLTPVRLALAGSAISALLLALSEGIALKYRIGQSLDFWLFGGAAGVRWEQVDVILPWIGGGLVVALLLSRYITLLSLGEETAAGIGVRVGLIKLIGATVVLVLAGASVSVVGFVSFIGLMIPHITRYLVGVSYRWIVPCSAILGALLFVLADLGARMVRPGLETPVGALIAILGVPFLLYLARREGRSL
ncbi:FecCD family ABC transporter permease [Cohnella sp. JJ-181]|uniref:FecCD family ABC transporter permease n=1 Tax=Cohnella rhizoplanae TaxID=2974897 RepID=UPI0022FFB52C|nr:iron ABC transporter permease [Cohnella sp. JJ-181]CAI6055943.1 putative siderophore transport system permease protein YfiZ [Cohnella sp. JJ-181]